MLQKDLLTLKNLANYTIAALMTIFSINCFAAIKTITTPTFSIDLPTNMQQVLHREDLKINLYQYVFSTMPDSDYAPKQLRITVVSKAPENEKDYADWELKTLAAMTTFFIGAYHLNLEGQADVLGKAPDTLILGNQTFKSVTMTFNKNIQVKFLVTVTKNLTYMFTLISIDNDRAKRDKNMTNLIDSIKTVKYLGFET